jgi:hypothetical protein
MEHAAAKIRNAIKTRGLKKADEKVDFFCIASGMGFGLALLADIWDGCQPFSCFSGLFPLCNSSMLAANEMAMQATRLPLQLTGITDPGYNRHL